MQKSRFDCSLLALSLLMMFTFSIKAQITFESEPGHTPVDQQDIDNSFYVTNYGVSFYLKAPGTNTIIGDAKYAQMGAPASAFGNSTSLNHYTACSPSNTLGDFPWNTTHDLGCWFITDDNSLTVPNTLVIDYSNSTPTYFASGYMLDVDGPEGWEVNVYTSDPSTPEKNIQIVGPGWHSYSPNLSMCQQCDYDVSAIPLAQQYNVGTISNPKIVTNPMGTGLTLGNGDGTAHYWDVNTVDPISRIEIEYLGDPFSATVGVGFDGLGGVSNCQVDAGLLATIDANNPAKINATDQSTVGSGEVIVGKKWTIDGQVYYGDQISHVFSQSGTYSVCLEVTAVSGTGACCSDTYCENVTVSVPITSCIVDPEFTVQCYTGDDCLYLFNGDVGATNRNIKAWYWDFGDGTNSNLENPMHAFPAPGVYTVCLTLVGDDGSGQCCFEKICKSVTVDCNGIVPSTVCSKLYVNDIPLSDLKTVKTNSEPSLIEDKSAEEVISIAPNPFSQEAEVHLNFKQNHENVSLAIYSITGQLVEQLFQNKSFTLGSYTHTVKNTTVASGTYILKLEAESESKSIRILVE